MGLNLRFLLALSSWFLLWTTTVNGQFAPPLPMTGAGAGTGTGGGAGTDAGGLGGASRSLGTPSINNSFSRQPPQRPVRPGDRITTQPQLDFVAQDPRDPRERLITNDRVEFQDFVLQSTGRDLQIFGSDLFKNVPATFAPVDHVPVPSEYVIGPGDEILIRASGQVDIDYSVEVERNGTITIPRVGTISLVGIKYSDLQSHLKVAIGRVFRNFELNVSLGQLRSIQIFIVGQARRPGSYTVGSMTTLVNAIFAAGGPSARGSMRGIQLKRGSRLVTEFDLYELLINGDKSKDAQLLPGDVIQIPPVSGLVAISGSVNVQGIYELGKNSTMTELVAWAGGLASTASGQKITIERIEGRNSRKVDEFNLGELTARISLRDGDLITVNSISPRIENAVTLRGNVAQPARVPWRQGMRVNDLIPQKEALLSRNFWLQRNQTVGLESSIAELIRRNRAAGVEISVEDLLRKNQLPESDIAAMTLADSMRRTQIAADVAAANAESLKKLQAGQPTTVLPGLPTNTPRPFGQTGAIAPLLGPDFPTGFGPAPQAANAERASGRLLDEIKPNLGEVNWDYAVIERLNPQNFTATILPFNLAKAISENDPTHNIVLLPGDIVTIFSVDDIQGPTAKQTKYVRFEGEFNNSGVYAVQPGETLRQLIARVGGVTQNAYLFGAEFTRDSTRIFQQKKLEEAINRLERELQRSAVTRSKNVVSPEEATGLGQEAAAQQSLVARLRQAKATGRIVLEVPPEESARLNSLPDLLLEDGDRMVLPFRPSTINVVGAVYNENAFVFRSDKRLNDYLRQAGGVSKYGAKDDVYVLRADGSVLSKQQDGYFSTFDGARLLPGDTVVVPEEVDRVTWTKTLKDYGQILYQFGLGAAALKVLR